RSEEHTSELQSHLNLVCRISRSEEHTSELQSHLNLVCRLLLEKKKKRKKQETKHKEDASEYRCERVPYDHDHTRALIAYSLLLAHSVCYSLFIFFFFLKDTAPPKISTFPLPAALPI